MLNNLFFNVEKERSRQKTDIKDHTKDVRSKIKEEDSRRAQVDQYQSLVPSTTLHYVGF